MGVFTHTGGLLQILSVDCFVDPDLGPWDGQTCIWPCVDCGVFDHACCYGSMFRRLGRISKWVTWHTSLRPSVDTNPNMYRMVVVWNPLVSQAPENGDREEEFQPMSSRQVSKYSKTLLCQHIIRKDMHSRCLSLLKDAQMEREHDCVCLQENSTGYVYSLMSAARSFSNSLLSSTLKCWGQTVEQPSF